MSVRKPGDPIGPDVVRDCRARHGMTQDEFAEALGFLGGKNVISAWETGRSPCQGPAAELVLERYGAGLRITGIQHAALNAEERELYQQMPNGDVYVRAGRVPHG